MKAAEISALRNKSATELQADINELVKIQFELRMQNSVGQLGQPHLLREARKDIARTKTILNEKKREALPDKSQSAV